SVVHSSGIRCMDLSADKGRLVVVDKNAQCHTYRTAAERFIKALDEDEDTKDTGGSLSTIEGVVSVACNSVVPDLYAISGIGRLAVYLGSFPLYVQTIANDGFVIGFARNCCYLFIRDEISVFTVPVSPAVRHLITKARSLAASLPPPTDGFCQEEVAAVYRKALEIANLQVPASTWRDLGSAALLGGCLDVAREAYLRVMDVAELRLVEQAQDILYHETDPAEKTKRWAYIRAEMLARLGQYAQAGPLYLKAGKPNDVIDLAMPASPTMPST
ncbi:hypothetical protein KIPB_005675, partial [Kipferlia bialata]